MAISTVFAFSFITALSGAIMPGPLLTLTIAMAARRGFIAPVLLIVGHSILELLVVVGLVFGLGKILEIRPVIGTITVLGGLMLLWMGYGMIRDARKGALDIEVTAKEGQGTATEVAFRNPVAAGIALSISNPYWVIWWATVGLTLFTALSRNAAATISAFYLGHISGDLLWYMAVVAAVTGGRKLMSPAVYRGIVQACGTFLLFLGASFLYLVATGDLWEVKMTLDWPWN